MKPPREARLLRSHHLPRCCRQPQHAWHPAPPVAEPSLRLADCQHRQQARRNQPSCLSCLAVCHSPPRAHPRRVCQGFVQLPEVSSLTTTFPPAQGHRAPSPSSSPSAPAPRPFLSRASTWIVHLHAHRSLAGDPFPFRNPSRNPARALYLCRPPTPDPAAVPYPPVPPDARGLASMNAAHRVEGSKKPSSSFALSAERARRPPIQACNALQALPLQKPQLPAPSPDRRGIMCIRRATVMHKMMSVDRRYNIDVKCMLKEEALRCNNQLEARRQRR